MADSSSPPQETKRASQTKRADNKQANNAAARRRLARERFRDQFGDSYNPRDLQQLFTGPDAPFRKAIDNAVRTSIGDNFAKLQFPVRKVAFGANGGYGTGEVQEPGMNSALRLALASEDAPIPKESASERAYADSLKSNTAWKDLRALPMSTLEKMAAAKVLSVFMEDPANAALLYETFPDFDMRYPTLAQKRVILSAFMLDLFGSDFLGKVWRGAKKLGSDAVGKLWSAFKESDTFKDAKSMLEDLAKGISTGDPKAILHALEEGASLATQLSSIATPAGLKKLATDAGAALVGGEDEDSGPLASADHVQRGGQPSAMQPYVEASAGKTAFYQDSRLVRNRIRFSYDAVSLAAVAGWICPEDFPSRMPVDMTQRTALAASTWTRGFSTGSTGNLGLYIFPWAIVNTNPVFTPGAPYVYPFCLPYTSSAFNPSTGNCGLAATSSFVCPPAPLDSVRTSIQAYRVNSCSLRLTTTPSLTNSQGMVQVAYFTDFPNSSFNPPPDTSATGGPGPSIPQTDLANMTNYQLFNFKTAEVRESTVIDGPSDLTMLTTSGDTAKGLPCGSEGWYILVTGAAGGAQVITVTISYDVEYLPTVSALPLLNLLYADPGPATLSLISNLIKANPTVLRLPLASARQLASTIISLDSSSHNDVLNAILDFLEALPPQQHNTSGYVAPAMPQELELQPFREEIRAVYE